MNKIIVIGGGPAGMFAAIAQRKPAVRLFCLKRMKNLGKNFSLPERDDAILPMREIWIISLQML